ncbi:MAG: flagellar motor switch protein FliM [Oscillibacter sp.]|nr:flagellar motor switch protein FliM [Oscillibacter sp.]
MAEVLSQSQIDALLQAAFNPEPDKQEPKERYQKYDFRSPRKYTKERLKMLNGVFDNYVKVLTTRINALVHATCEVSVDTVDEQRYYEFSNALLEGSVVSLAYLRLDGQREDTPVIICATPSIMISMFDRLCGGTGNVDDLPSDYAYTNVDLSLYAHLISEFISLLSGSWENYLHLNFEFGRVETNPTLVQLIGLEETVVVVSIDVNFANASGRFDICLADEVLNRIFEGIAKQNRAMRRQLEDHSEEIYSHLEDTDLVITAELGRTWLRLRDIYTLNVGDVIDMNIKADSAVSLWIGERQWFSGLMGVDEKHVAVKIRDVHHIEGGSEQEDE